MKIQTARRYVFSTALIATFLVGAAFAIPQDRRIRVENEVALPIKGGCPKPMALTLNATTPNVFAPDFTPGMLALPRAFLNDPVPNKRFVYTFEWKSNQRCCEITSAILTVKLKANQAGTIGGSNAGNDGIAIVHAGIPVPPFNEPVFSPLPVPAGQTVTKTWPLSGAALSNLKTNHLVSMFAQDDVMVQSATLQIYGCCLTTPGRSSVEEAQPAREEN
jgi:hypothetical protein